jgi:hypothetical protein
MTTDEIFDALEAPFEPHEVKQREGDRGRLLSYIDAPTARRRLNAVLGRDGWACDMEVFPNGVKCRITITLPDGNTLTRADLGGYPKMPSEEDSFKGGASDAFKRAAALFGVAAYLSDDNHPAQPARQAQSTNGRQMANGHGNGHSKVRGVWGGGPRPAAQAPGNQGPARAGGQPRTGRALYAKLMEKDRDCRGIFKHIVEWGSAQGFPAKVTDWSFDEVKQAEGEVARAMASASN